MFGAAGFLFGICGAALALSILVLLPAGQWFAPEVLASVWLSMLTIPAGLSFATLIVYRHRWPAADRTSRIRIFSACAVGLASVHWAVVGILLASVSVG